MGITLNTNVSAFNAGRQLNKTQNNLAKSFERLSSGVRINRAADDVGGLRIADKFTSQIKGLGQAIRNSNDGISLLQTAEGALNETTNILQRMRELSIQSANDTMTSQDRGSIQSEVDALKTELDRIANETSFNGQKILDGSFSGKNLQIGADANQSLAVSFQGARSTDVGKIAQQTGANAADANALGAGELQINGVNVQAATAGSKGGQATDSAWAKAQAINASGTGVTAEAQAVSVTSNAANAISNGDITLTMNGQAIFNGTGSPTTVTGVISGINAFSSETGVVASAGSGSKVVLTASDGRNIDITVAGKTLDTNPFSVAATRGKVQLTSSSTIALTDLVGAGAGTGRIGFTATSVTLDTQTINDIDVTSSSGANSAISRIDSALEVIGQRRVDMGATQNRLESTISNLGNVQENTMAARSRLMDVDFASETINLTKGQLLQQAGAAILSQAKSSSQLALSLLN